MVWVLYIAKEKADRDDDEETPKKSEESAQVDKVTDHVIEREIDTSKVDLSSIGSAGIFDCAIRFFVDV